MTSQNKCELFVECYMMEYLYSIYYDGKINMNYSVIVRRKRKKCGCTDETSDQVPCFFCTPSTQFDRAIGIWNTQMTDGENKR